MNYCCLLTKCYNKTRELYKCLRKLHRHSGDAGSFKHFKWDKILTGNKGTRKRLNTLNNRPCCRLSAIHLMWTTLCKIRTVVISLHCYNIIACCNQITIIKGFFDDANRSWYLRSSGLLRSVQLQFLTDVSGQSIGPIFKGQVVQGLVKQSKGWTVYPWRWDG